jgi:hypothetical protein
LLLPCDELYRVPQVADPRHAPESRWLHDRQGSADLAQATER